MTSVANDGSYKTEMQGSQGEKSYGDYAGNTYKVVQLYKDGETVQETRAMLAEYDNGNRVTRVYDENNLTETRNDYDALGNVRRSWTYVETQNNVRMYAVKQYSYDLEGRVTSVREKTTLQAYRNADVDASDADLVTTYTYDANAGSGLTVDTVTAADGSVTKTYQNAMGQTVKEEQLGKDGSKKLVKQYSYDQYGRQTAIQYGQNSLSTRQSYTYDDLDRVKTQTTGDTTTTFTYDYFGRRAAMTDVNSGNINILTTWKYDKNDKAVQLVQDGKVVNYRYNSAGDMIAMQYGAMGNVRTTGYEYDDTGRLTAVKSSIRPAAADGAPMDTSELKTVKAYAYAPNGDLTSTTEYLEFDRKEDQQGLTVQGTFTYDSLGRPLSLTYTQNGTEKEKYTLTYDGQGYILTENYVDAYQDSYTKNAIQTTSRGYTYDAIGRIKQNTVTKGTQNKTIAYVYDKAGNRIKETTNQRLEDNSTVVSTKNYTYNNLSQLTEVKESSTIRSGETTLTYTDQTLAKYTYDDYGNQTGQETYEVNPDTLQSAKTKDLRNTYDTANQLIKVEEKANGASGWTMLNTSLYNGEGQRIRKTDGSSTNGDYTMYFYMGGSLAFSTNSDTNYITDENILDPNGTIIAGKRQDNVYNPDKPEGQYWIYHYDARGSVTNIIGTDANGALYRAENNVYDAFGKDDSGSATPTTSIKNEVKFTGAVQDSNGLYYANGYHYNPITGTNVQESVEKDKEIVSLVAERAEINKSVDPTQFMQISSHQHIKGKENLDYLATDFIMLMSKNRGTGDITWLRGYSNEDLFDMWKREGNPKKKKEIREQLKRNRKINKQKRENNNKGNKKPSVNKKKKQEAKDNKITKKIPEKKQLQVSPRKTTPGLKPQPGPAPMRQPDRPWAKKNNSKGWQTAGEATLWGVGGYLLYKGIKWLLIGTGNVWAVALP